MPRRPDIVQNFIHSLTTDPEQRAQRLSRRTVLGLLAGSTATLVLAACTDDDSDDDPAVVDEPDPDDDEPVEEPEDEEPEEVAEPDDSAEASDDAEEVAAAESDDDDSAVDDATEDTAEITDDSDEFALDDEEFEAVLAALGFDPDDEEIEAPPLDLETMTAETPAMTLEARAYDNVYVGDITEELLVAVSMDSDYAGEADSISAYVCDGHDVGFYVTGHIENGQASIQLAENAVLEFTVNGEEISGSVTMNEQELGSFDAVEATGDAGFYVAETNVDGTDVGARWIVLEDGRQAGQMCIGVWARGVCIGVYVSRN